MTPTRGRVANASEFIEALSLGYQTRIGDSGMRLSGGHLERGRLVEQGTHEELLRRAGLYAYPHAQQLEAA